MNVALCVVVDVWNHYGPLLVQHCEDVGNVQPKRFRDLLGSAVPWSSVKNNRLSLGPDHLESIIFEIIE